MMLIRGYTSDLSVMKCEMSIDEIVARGIDPWRLDLFDPAAIIVRVETLTDCLFGGERKPAGKLPLRFSPLRPVTFAYREGTAATIGVYDGSKRSVLQGTCDRNRSHANLVLTDFRKTNFRFNTAFARYLQISEWGQKKLTTKQAQSWPPSSGNPLHLHNGELGFVNPDFAQYERIVASSYTGTMFERVTISLELSPAVNWVLNAFGPWKPVVFGACLRHAFTNTRPPSVDFLLQVPESYSYATDGTPWFDGLSLASLEHSGSRDCEVHCFYTGPIYTFTIGAQSYRALVNRFPGKEEYWRKYCRDSVHQLVCTTPNTVEASRIALHDISIKLVRAVNPSLRDESPAVMKFFEQHPDLLLKQGFSLPRLVMPAE